LIRVQIFPDLLPYRHGSLSRFLSFCHLCPVRGCCGSSPSQNAIRDRPNRPSGFSTVRNINSQKRGNSRVEYPEILSTSCIGHRRITASACKWLGPFSLPDDIHHSCRVWQRIHHICRLCLVISDRSNRPCCFLYGLFNAFHVSSFSSSILSNLLVNAHFLFPFLTGH
jgi:hypothetical protein